LGWVVLVVLVVVVGSGCCDCFRWKIRRHCCLGSVSVVVDGFVVAGVSGEGFVGLSIGESIPGFRWAKAWSGDMLLPRWSARESAPGVPWEEASSDDVPSATWIARVEVCKGGGEIFKGGGKCWKGGREGGWNWPGVLVGEVKRVAGEVYLR
jgi:hypothetical protein